MTTDTDPTPPHGTPRPSKTRVLHLLLDELTIQHTELTNEINALIDQRARITEDINSIEQILIDLAPTD